jgi:hypothetical protein
MILGLRKNTAKFLPLLFKIVIVRTRNSSLGADNLRTDWREYKLCLLYTSPLLYELLLYTSPPVFIVDSEYVHDVHTSLKSSRSRVAPSHHRSMNTGYLSYRKSPLNAATHKQIS